VLCILVSVPLARRGANRRLFWFGGVPNFKLLLPAVPRPAADAPSVTCLTVSFRGRLLGASLGLGWPSLIPGGFARPLRKPCKPGTSFSSCVLWARSRIRPESLLACGTRSLDRLSRTPGCVNLLDTSGDILEGTCLFQLFGGCCLQCSSQGV